MTRQTGAAPPGYHTVTPYLMVADVLKEIEFVRSAFGAEETTRNERPDGSIGHAEVRLGDSVVMMGQAGAASATPSVVHLYVDDSDATYRQALQAGGTSLREPADQPYGDRMAGVKDPLGNSWWIATPIRK